MTAHVAHVLKLLPDEQLHDTVARLEAILRLADPSSSALAFRQSEDYRETLYEARAELERRRC